MTVHVGLCQTWSEIPKTGFLRSQLKCVFNFNEILTSAKCNASLSPLSWADLKTGISSLASPTYKVDNSMAITKTPQEELHKVIHSDRYFVSCPLVENTFFFFFFFFLGIFLVYSHLTPL